MNTQKISQYFFILAAVISILDGAFKLDESMISAKLMFLVIAGVVVGVLRSQDSEKDFLIAGIAVIFTGLIFTEFMGDYLILGNFSSMILNFMLFLSTAVIVVGLEIIAEVLTKSSQETSAKKLLKQESNLTEEELHKLAFQKIWGTVILVAVALTFIILLAESFFDVSKFQSIIYVLDISITILFLVDLIVLYNDSRNFHEFLKNNIFDIIASIPTVGVLRGLKLIRAIKIIRLMRMERMLKLTKIYKTGKFFSEESYFNVVNDSSKSSKKATKKSKVKNSTKIPKKTNRKLAKKPIKKVPKKAKSKKNT